MQACRLRSHIVDVTPPQAATKNNGGSGGMAEWRNGGMAVRRKEWQNSRMAEMATYVLFTVHTDDTDTDNNNDDDDTLIFYSIE